MAYSRSYFRWNCQVLASVGICPSLSLRVMPICITLVCSTLFFMTSYEKY